MKLTFKSNDLKRLLGNAILFAGKDDKLPFICAVRFAFEGEYLHFVATDRYVLSWEPAREVAIEGERAEFSLKHRDAVDILRALPKRGTEDVTIEHAPDITVTMPGRVFQFGAVEGDFPKWQALTGVKAAERAGISLNGEYLALLAKVDTGSPRHHTARFTLPEGQKPVLVEMGETFKVVICPVRDAG